MRPRTFLLERKIDVAVIDIFGVHFQVKPLKSVVMDRYARKIGNFLFSHSAINSHEIRVERPVAMIFIIHAPIYLISKRGQLGDKYGYNDQGRLEYLMSKFIPFRWLPGSWGLSGKSFDEAEARYSLDGIDLELRLAEIAHADDAVALSKARADIQKSHGLLDDYAWMHAHIMAETGTGTGTDAKAQEVELIKLDIEFARIEKRDGEKKIANLLDEPWVGIVEEGLDAAQGPNGFYFAFDWNDAWIRLLRESGYEGESEDDLMERWFTDVCRNEVMNSAPIPFNSSVVYD